MATSTLTFDGVVGTELSVYDPKFKNIGSSQTISLDGGGLAVSDVAGNISAYYYEDGQTELNQTCSGTLNVTDHSSNLANAVFVHHTTLVGGIGIQINSDGIDITNISLRRVNITTGVLDFIESIDFTDIVDGAGTDIVYTITATDNLAGGFTVAGTVDDVPWTASHVETSIGGYPGFILYNQDHASEVTLTAASVGAFTLVMNGADITLDGASATFINTALTSEPQSLWFPANTWKEPTFGQVTFGVPTQVLTLQMLGADITIDSADASFVEGDFIFSISMEGADITLSGESASFALTSIPRSTASNTIKTPDTISGFGKRGKKKKDKKIELTNLDKIKKD